MPERTPYTEVERGAPGCTCGTPPFAPPEPAQDCPFHHARAAFAVTVQIAVPGASREVLEEAAMEIAEFLDSDHAARVLGAVVAGTFDPPALEIDMTVAATDVVEVVRALVNVAEIERFRACAREQRSTE